jgi:phosphopantothenoylcysteine synthetase/decarboxylase
MNVVVTGGGTVAPIDDVRQITNVSSGRFSATITEACLERGCTVWHVHAPGAQLPYQRLARFDLDAPDPAAEHERLDRLRSRWLARRASLHLVPLAEGTVADYLFAVHSVMTEHPIDLAFFAMAVSDFEPVPFAGKLESRAGALSLPCQPTRKVIQSVREWAPDVYLVGFKLLSRSGDARLIAAAEEGNRVYRADLTVANDLQTLRAGRHTIHLVRPGRPTETLGPPEPIADRLVDRAMSWAGEKSRP